MEVREDKNEVPIWHKYSLTIQEAAKYTGIGQNTLSALTKMPRCPFVLYVGNKRMIKREKLVAYLDSQKSVEMKTKI